MQAPDLNKHEAAKEVMTVAEAIAAQLQDFSITTAVHYQDAGLELTRIKLAASRLETVRKSITQPMDQAKKAVLAFFKPAEERLENAERTIKAAMLTYQRQQERLRLEQQRKLDEAAAKERLKIEERARKAAEAGKIEKAQSLEQQARTVVAPLISRTIPKVAGVQVRENWLFEIVDPLAIPREYLAIDETKIRKVVQALKGATQIAGIRIYSEDAIAACGAAAL